MKQKHFIHSINSILIFLSLAAFSPWHAVAAQQRAAKPDKKFHQEKRKPAVRHQVLTNRYKMKLVRVPAGNFQMGLSEREARAMFEHFLKIDGETKLEWFSNAAPKHRVKIKHSFYLGQTEVTQREWRLVMGKTVREQRDQGDPASPLYGEGDDYPVYYVSWTEANEFIQRLNSLHDGFIYHLPSEAEWEYAARAGTTRYFTGAVDSLAWYINNSGRTPLAVPEIVGSRDGDNYVKQSLENGGGAHRVGTKQANAFGLYDMTGNVWEWCADVSHPNYAGAPSDGSSWTTGGDSQYRVLRGGSWINDLSNLHTSYRSGFVPDGHSFQHGLRIAASRH